MTVRPHSLLTPVLRRRLRQFALTSRLSVWLKACLKTAHTRLRIRRIKEVEMATSAGDLETSRSISGQLFPNFDTPDAKIAFLSDEDRPKFKLPTRVHSVEQKGRKDVRFFCGRQRPGAWGLQGRSATGGTARVPFLRVCRHPSARVAHAGENGE